MNTSSDYPVIKIPHHISRTFIQQHPEYIFLYAGDVKDKSILGQAWAAKGAPNAFAIPTLYKYCTSSAVYFTDSRRSEWTEYIDNAFSLIPNWDKPIIPFPKIGRGCSRLQELGPKVYEYIHKRINEIKYPNIEYIYHA